MLGDLDLRMLFTWQGRMADESWGEVGGRVGSIQFSLEVSRFTEELYLPLK